MFLSGRCFQCGVQVLMHSHLTKSQSDFINTDQSPIAFSLCVHVFSQRCASRAVIRSMASALYQENASESDDLGKFLHLHLHGHKGEIICNFNINVMMNEVTLQDEPEQPTSSTVYGRAMMLFLNFSLD